jgi:UDP-N-acetylmuramoyl-L-alanyl-D-glutamate--2,6-diaminopimelate ligase
VIQGAEPGEIVVIAGKGHETTQTIGTRRYDFDDRTRARAVLAERAEVRLSEDLG